MKKLFQILTISMSLFILPQIVMAQGSQPGQGIQQKVQDPVVYEAQAEVNQTGNQVQNQVKTQNAGEDSQLQVNTQESLQASQSGVQFQDKGDTTEKNMNTATEKIEKLLNIELEEDVLRQQVKTLAGQQKQAQSEIKTQLDKLELRSAFMKKLFGSDREAIKNLKMQMEQNQLRIQQLTQLKTKLVNQADTDQIQEAVQALIEQNTALNEQIQAEEKAGGIFSWLVNLFAR